MVKLMTKVGSNIKKGQETKDTKLQNSQRKSEQFHQSKKLMTESWSSFYHHDHRGSRI